MKNKGVYIALGTLALLGLTAGAIIIAQKCRKCKNY